MQSDIKNLQIRVEGLPTIDGVPTVYLDGMEVEVEFMRPVGRGDRPIVRLKDSSVLFSSGERGFRLQERPTFTVEEPRFTTAFLQQLVQERRAVVLADRQGRLGRPVFAEQDIIDKFAPPQLAALVPSRGEESGDTALSTEDPPAGEEKIAEESEDDELANESADEEPEGFFEPLKKIAAHIVETSQIENLGIEVVESEESSKEDAVVVEEEPVEADVVNSPSQEEHCHGEDCHTHGKEPTSEVDEGIFTEDSLSGEEETVSLPIDRDESSRDDSDAGNEKDTSDSILEEPTPTEDAVEEEIKKEEEDESEKYPTTLTNHQ